MLGPCDQCVRRQAVHTWVVSESGKQKTLRLCEACFHDRRHSTPAPDPPTVEEKLLDHERSIAGELQRNLLPGPLPDLSGYDLRAFFRGSRDIGGDYYDFFPIDADRLAIVVAHVSAKGIPASIVMTETRALIRTEAVRAPSPVETLIRVNGILYKDIQRGLFVTLFYLILSREKSSLTAVSAGHNPMVLWRKESNTCHLVNPNGLALGIDKGLLFERTLKEQVVQLSSGDRFTLYTDGAIEAMNARGEEFGQNRFYLRSKQLADRSSDGYLEALVREIDGHRDGAEPRDDFTIVTGRVLLPPGE